VQTVRPHPLGLTLHVRDHLHDLAVQPLPRLERVAVLGIVEPVLVLVEIDAERVLRLCAALFTFWYMRGYNVEGQSFLEQAVALRSGAAASVRAKVLSDAAIMAFFSDDLERAEALREVLGAPMHPVERADYEQAVAAARMKVGEEALSKAWTKGRATPVEQVVARALRMG